MKSKDGEPEPGTVDKNIRHFNFGAEDVVTWNVNLMVGYNYLVHQELKLPDAGGGAGISFGFSAMIKTFEFVFSRSAYIVGNAGYTFTISKNIDNMMKRTKVMMDPNYLDAKTDRRRTRQIYHWSI